MCLAQGRGRFLTLGRLEEEGCALAPGTVVMVRGPPLPRQWEERPEGLASHSSPYLPATLVCALYPSQPGPASLPLGLGPSPSLCPAGTGLLPSFIGAVPSIAPFLAPL